MPDGAASLARRWAARVAGGIRWAWEAPLRTPPEALGLVLGYLGTASLRARLAGTAEWWWGSLVSAALTALALHVLQLWLVTGRVRQACRHFGVILSWATAIEVDWQDRDLARSWCEENCRGSWIATPTTLFFNRKSDAALFMLFWDQPLRRL